MTMTMTYDYDDDDHHSNNNFSSEDNDGIKAINKLEPNRSKRNIRTNQTFRNKIKIRKKSRNNHSETSNLKPTVNTSFGNDDNDYEADEDVDEDDEVNKLLKDPNRFSVNLNPSAFSRNNPTMSEDENMEFKRFNAETENALKLLRNLQRTRQQQETPRQWQRPTTNQHPSKKQTSLRHSN